MFQNYQNGSTKFASLLFSTSIMHVKKRINALAFNRYYFKFDVNVW